jgi:hypothetical protein
VPRFYTEIVSVSSHASNPIHTLYSLLSAVLTLQMPGSIYSPLLSVCKEKSNTEVHMAPEGFVAKVIAVIRLVWLILFTKVVTSVANSISATVFPLILKNVFSIGEQKLGLIMSAMSFFNAIVNGLLMAPIVEWAGGQLGTVSRICLSSMALLSGFQAFLALPDAINLYSFLSLAFVISMFQYVLGTTLTSDSTSRVADDAKGTLLGLEHSLFAVARVFAPYMASNLLISGGTATVCAVPSLIFATVYVVWNQFYNARSNEAESQKSDIDTSSNSRKKSF